MCREGRDTIRGRPRPPYFLFRNSKKKKMKAMWMETTSTTQSCYHAQGWFVGRLERGLLTPIGEEKHQLPKTRETDMPKKRPNTVTITHYESLGGKSADLTSGGKN